MKDSSDLEEYESTVGKRRKMSDRGIHHLLYW